MHNHYTTDRLELDSITLEDAEFILALVNTAGWLRFIGDRKIRTAEDARVYIQKIIEKPDQHYWVARLREENIPVGIITFLKRDYLEHYDIGFAFLPEYAGKGYAYEAAASVLYDVINDPTHKIILATTVKENSSSIKLLEKLGLRFEQEIRVDEEPLSVYGASTDKLMLDKLTKDFYSLFTNAKGKPLALERISDMCYAEASIVKYSEGKAEFFSVATFVSPRKVILSDGTLTEFEEYEVFEETSVSGHVAQRLSRYRKNGCLNGAYFERGGSKLFQYARADSGWKISSIIWEDEKY
jgi:RimJ/RimL family protein N-acetyltransferase